MFYGEYNVYISSMMPSTKQKGPRREAGPPGHGLEIVLRDTEKFLGFGDFLMCRPGDGLSV